MSNKLSRLAMTVSLDCSMSILFLRPPLSGAPSSIACWFTVIRSSTSPALRPTNCKCSSQSEK